MQKKLLQKIKTLCFSLQMYLNQIIIIHNADFSQFRFLTDIFFIGKQLSTRYFGLTTVVCPPRTL